MLINFNLISSNAGLTALLNRLQKASGEYDLHGIPLAIAVINAPTEEHGVTKYGYRVGNTGAPDTVTVETTNYLPANYVTGNYLAVALDNGNVILYGPNGTAIDSSVALTGNRNPVNRVIKAVAAVNAEGLYNPDFLNAALTATFIAAAEILSEDGDIIGTYYGTTLTGELPCNVSISAANVEIYDLAVGASLVSADPEEYAANF